MSGRGRRHIPDVAAAQMALTNAKPAGLKLTM